MGRYPKEPLEDRLLWMRKRQKAKAEKEARAKEEAPQQAAPEVTRVEAMLQDLLRHLAQPVVAERKALPQMLRVEVVADALSVSPRTVYRWFADRAIIVQTGPRKTTMLIPQEVFDEWFAEHRQPNSR